MAKLFNVQCAMFNACEAKVDLLLIQEPYTIGGRVAGFGADERPWAAIVMLNRSFSILRVGQMSTPYTACAEITCDQGRMPHVI